MRLAYRTAESCQWIAMRQTPILIIVWIASRGFTMRLSQEFPASDRRRAYPPTNSRNLAPIRRRGGLL